MDQEYWFNSEDGIRRHYADEREAEAAEHRRRMQRIDTTENDMIEALRKAKEKNNG